MKIVAELSANHLGSLDRALTLVDIAARAGAWGVKLQTFTPEQMADAGTVISDGPWKGRKLLDLYRQAHTPRAWHATIFDYAKVRGLVAFSSVFHTDDVDFLETLDCPIYKIASFEITDTRLIAYAAATRKPIVISTGMATNEEISAAIDTVFTVNRRAELTLLKCTSAYPSDAREANLATMGDMSQWKWRDDIGYSYPLVGLSDHTPGIGVAVAATVLGAAMIEKHLTISRFDGGPDAGFSMEPKEFAQLVIECKRAEAAIGTVQYGPQPCEMPSLALRRVPGGKRGEAANLK